jgi:hypothetical protein
MRRYYYCRYPYLHSACGTTVLSNPARQGRESTVYNRESLLLYYRSAPLYTYSGIREGVLQWTYV